MSALNQAAIEFERRYATSTHGWNEVEGCPFLVVPARVAFMTGAAAMAEIFAQGQGPVLEELRALRSEWVRAQSPPQE